MLLGIRGIEESSVYQAIYNKGFVEGFVRGYAKGYAKGVRKALICLGSKKFGPPRKSVRAKIEGLEDLGRLEALIDRLPYVATWNKLLSPSD